MICRHLPRQYTFHDPPYVTKERFDVLLSPTRQSPRITNIANLFLTPVVVELSIEARGIPELFLTVNLRPHSVMIASEPFVSTPFEPIHTLPKLHDFKPRHDWSILILET